MILTLASEERQVLLEVLAWYERDLRWLIGRADDRECREAMRRKAAIVETLLERLEFGGLDVQTEVVGA